MLVVVAQSKMIVVGVVRSGWIFLFFKLYLKGSHAYLTNQIQDVRASGRGRSGFGQSG